MAKHVTEVSDAEFEEAVLKSDVPVLVDFWAPWCGPCLQISPVVEELANEYEGRVNVVKVNVDNNRQYAAKYNVQGIPNFILFKDGQVQHQKTGAAHKQELVDLLQTVL